MPTKKVSYRNDKAVLVRVYVEKPRKKNTSSIQHHYHHHYHIHHTVRQEVVHGNSASNKGYDRRSGLLMYSRLQRNSARGGASSTPLLSKWFANNSNIQPPTQMTPLKKKPKHAERPAWFGNLKLIIPSFLISWSNDQKKEKKKKQMQGGLLVNGIKKLQVRRGKCFIPKVFSTCTKCA